MSDPQTTGSVSAPIASLWLSKINWAQAVSAIAMLLALATGGQLSMTADQQVALVGTIGLVTNIVTFVIKTWFSSTVTSQSATMAKLPAS